MTVLVYLKEAIESHKRDARMIPYAVEEIEISELLDTITEKYGIERAKKFSTKDLIIYASSMVMKRPEEIILRSKTICKGA